MPQPLTANPPADASHDERQACLYYARGWNDCLREMGPAPARLLANPLEIDLVRQAWSTCPNARRLSRREILSLLRLGAAISP